ncbi:hypothetical protein MRX96_024463 [Rhipicephalus microplus]
MRNRAARERLCAALISDAAAVARRGRWVHARVLSLLLFVELKKARASLPERNASLPPFASSLFLRFDALLMFPLCGVECVQCFACGALSTGVHTGSMCVQERIFVKRVH